MQKYPRHIGHDNYAEHEQGMTKEEIALLLISLTNPTTSWHVPQQFSLLV